MNGKRVAVEVNENGNDRGLHIVVINPFNGQIEFARVFDTSISSEEFDELITVPAN